MIAAYYQRELAHVNQRTRKGVEKGIRDFSMALMLAPRSHQIYQDRGAAHAILLTEFGVPSAREQAEADLSQAIQLGSLFAYYARGTLYRHCKS